MKDVTINVTMFDNSVSVNELRLDADSINPTSAHTTDTADIMKRGCRHKCCGSNRDLGSRCSDIVALVLGNETTNIIKLTK